jgi:hypothetical protein
MKKEILGIMRDKKFSPNHIENDAKIMQATANELKKFGFDVKVTYENTFVKNNDEFSAYFSMARNNNSLLKLHKLQNNGAIVVNSSKGVFNSFRETQIPILQEHKIKIPNSIVVNTDDFDSELLNNFPGKKVWLKRENHSLHREDVTPIYSKQECEATIREFKRRGIKRAILQEHKAGTEVKFYGVRETEFFFWYYVNGVPHHSFSEQELVNISNEISDLLQLDIYGGDAIISPEGDISIIDFNDWPSFAPIREQAGKYIANLIHSKLSGVN